eukprot:TRINITY_DN437_c0_g3_i1.p1 TRINITY_DN437_c0_g3~~TRINITY_DN437_c0_g3_i1.p1  ORF type:complete len:304 (+),score=66.10 TRINITY_DN437_c0_g3_i1:36-914(+)
MSKSEIENLIDEYKQKKDGSDERKEIAKKLGPLMLNTNLDFNDIAFIDDDDLQCFFSSKCYRHLPGETEFFIKMEDAFMRGRENGLAPEIKKNLLKMLDIPMLSFETTRNVENYLTGNEWGPPILDGMRKRVFRNPTREYQGEVDGVVVTKADLANDTSSLDEYFKKGNNKCILDADGFLDESGTLNTASLNRLPLSVKHISFISYSGLCTAIGDGFLENRSNLETADFSCLLHVKCIGDDFLSGCSSLKFVHLPGDLRRIGGGFLSKCESLTDREREELNLEQYMDWCACP